MSSTLTTDKYNTPDFLTLLKCRDESAMQEFMTAHLPQIFRAARGAGLNEQNAEDVSQNTFITFIEKIGEFEGRSNVRTWLFGILYHKISETRRSSLREGQSDDIDDIMESRFKTNGFWASPPQDADKNTFNREIRVHLEECLDGVTTEQRMAFLLREVEEMDSDEICQTMKLSRSNLGVVLFRGRNKLRECLEHRSIKG